jgi:hypothetical protein
MASYGVSRRDDLITLKGRLASEEIVDHRATSALAPFLTLPGGHGVPPFFLKESAMRDIYQDVTDKIITTLDQGVAPWIKPGPHLATLTSVINPTPSTPSRDIRIRASIYRCSGQRPDCRGSLKTVG